MHWRDTDGLAPKFLPKNLNTNQFNTDIDHMYDSKEKSKKSVIRKKAAGTLFIN